MSASVDTLWRSGRFDSATGPKKILFGRMYEDSAIELEVFAGRRRIFCIASAGCTALALAETHDVTAVDINPVQLRYAQARIDGAAPQTGSAERLMRFGRSLMKLAGWHRRQVEAFLDLDDVSAQMAHWKAHLDTRRFRWAVDGLLSLTGLRTVYASPFLALLPPHFGRVMRGRTERCWAQHPNRGNPYARLLLLGEAPVPALPRHARTIRLACADAASFLESVPAGSYDGFTLSNILDGASPEYRQRLFAAVRRAASPGSSLVLRSFGEPEAGPRSTPVHDLSDRDRSLLWGCVEVHPLVRQDAISDASAS